MGCFLFFTGLLLAGIAAAGLRPGLLDAPGPALGIWCAATAGYAGAVFMVLRRGHGAPGLWAVLAAALVLRLAALGFPAHFTTDYYRYIWDARVGAAGENPFRHAPSDPETAPLRHTPDNDVFHRINHKHTPTIYGPAAQALFRVARAVFGENPARWRILFLLADCAAVLLIAALLGAAGLPRAWCAVYALHPLVLVDFTANMHLDAVLLALLAASLLCAVRRRAAAAGLLLAGAALIKYFPILFLPLIAGLAVRHQETARGRLVRWGLCGAAFAAAVLLAYIPFMAPGVDLFAGLKTFTREFTVTQWSPYWLAQRVAGRAAADALMLAAPAGAALWCLAPGTARARLQRAFWVAAALALFAPVQRPWYFAWALPFCCVRAWWSWLLLGCLALLTYSLFIAFDYIYIVKPVQYLVFYAALAAELAFAVRARRREAARA